MLLDYLAEQEQGLILDELDQDLPPDPLWPHPEIEKRLDEAHHKLENEIRDVLSEIRERDEDT